MEPSEDRNYESLIVIGVSALMLAYESNSVLIRLDHIIELETYKLADSVGMESSQL